ncbi:MAG: HPr family phosphocarrier protein [Ruminococcaceae bacterium]|nr:HPr family phosphocarrier protein [Oscillospiraceae bacterium]
MKKVTIFLNTISDVKDFVGVVSKYDFSVDLVSGRYSVDAKSIMGIFSLDLSKPVELVAHSENEKECSKFMEELKPFIIK